MLGAREKSGNSRSSVESVHRSGPPDTGANKRFNGKEQKEREKRAGNWISVVVKKRVESNRKASGMTIQVVKKDSFLYEYAVYQKNRVFIGNIRRAIAGMVVRQPDFTCCTRGTTEAGKPARDTDYSSLTVPMDPELNAVSSIMMILSDYLIQVSKVSNDEKEQVIDYTFNDDIGLFSSFFRDVERRVFDNHEGLPDYEWNE